MFADIVQSDKELENVMFSVPKHASSY